MIRTIALLITLSFGLPACTSSNDVTVPPQTSTSGDQAASESTENDQEPIVESSAAPESPEAEPAVELTKVVKSDEEWRKILPAETYRITRTAGTERAFTGEYWDEKRVGSYLCVCCELELFRSDTKFKSGTGWPSFYEPARPGHVGEVRDLSHGMVRTEVVCNRCDAHLGHVFTDGPDPTGLRYCINSASLDFRAE